MLKHDNVFQQDQNVLLHRNQLHHAKYRIRHSIRVQNLNLENDCRRASWESWKKRWNHGVIGRHMPRGSGRRWENCTGSPLRPGFNPWTQVIAAVY